VSESKKPAEKRSVQAADKPSGELVKQDMLDRYFADVAKYPLLTRDQEHALAVRVHEHEDPEAAELLAVSNLRLVAKIAMEYRRVWTNVLDLIQEGNVGLLQAVKRFDPYRGVKLSSYAAYWIRAYILKYLIDNVRLVRVGGSRAERKLFFQLNRARKELESAGYAPEPKLLAEKLDVTEEDVTQMEQRLAQSDLSLDAPVSDEAGGASFGDLLASSDSVDEAIVTEDIKRVFNEYVDRFAAGLDERETRILRERVLAEDPKTLQEMGDSFGLTRERVRQIEAKIVARLRDYLQEHLVDFDYLAPES
jgi:RNA polymerase sigma-32 factor